MSSTCFEPKGSSSGRLLYMQLCCGMFPYHNCTYSYLPEDEPFNLKHVEDIKIKN